MSKKVFAEAISTRKDPIDAVSEAAESLKRGLKGASCDLALFFVCEGDPRVTPAALVKRFSEALGCRAALACNASGVVGGGREIEMQPSVAGLALHLPKGGITPFALSAKETSSLTPPGFIEMLDVYPNEAPSFICLTDGGGCDVDALLSLFNGGYGGRPLVGGLASGAVVGRPNWLCLDGEITGAAAVGVALSGEVELEIVVAQGCRPVGAPMTITKAEGHVLHELGGRPALEVLQEVVAGLSKQDRALAKHALFVGLAVSERRAVFKRGDFLVRNLMGYDARSGSLVLGSGLRAGQTLQFQLRDAATSDQDLRELVATLPRRGENPAAALLVSCCGRGRGLYGKPDHDAKLVQELRGPVPLAGFFANGELGPIGGRNYIHGYTSSLAVIR